MYIRMTDFKAFQKDRILSDLMIILNNEKNYFY
jgi:hypothetical protein